MKESLEKYKIKKLQAGGFMSYQPLPILPQQQPQESSAATSTNQPVNTGFKVIDDETRKALLGKGITNDVVAFESNMEKAYSEYQSMGEAERMSSRGKRLRSMMNGNVGVLNGLLRAKDQFTEAISNAKSNAAFGEVAVTANYGMVVKDMTTGNVAEISAQDYAKDVKAGKDRKYKALTVAELINEREYNQNLIGDEKSFEAINSTLGMTKIKDEVYQVLTTLSADSTSTTGNQFVDGRSAKILQGIQQMEELASQGIFDVTSSSSTESNTKSLQLALNAAWQNLSENSRSVLMARAAMRGVEPDKLQEEAQKYVMSLLAPKEYIKTDVKQDIKFDSGLTGAAGKGGAGAMDGMGYYELLANGTSSLMKPLTLNVGNGVNFTTQGRSAGGFVDGSGDPYGRTNLSNITRLTNIADMRSIYMGDQKIDPSRIESVVYEGGNVSTIHLPYERKEDGSIAPDFAALEYAEKAQKDIDALPATARTAMAIASIYKKYGVPTTADGKLDTKPFVTFRALTNTLAVKNGNSKYLINESKGANKDYVVKTYDQAYRTDSKGNEIDRPEYNLWTKLDPDVVSGMVYVPITADPITARMADKKDVNVSKSNTTLDHYMQAPGVRDVKTSNSGGSNFGIDQLSKIFR